MPANSRWDLIRRLRVKVKNEHLETFETMHIIELPDLCLLPSINANHYSYTLINVQLQIPPTCTT